jgi:hypothetical protein
MAKLDFFIKETSNDNKSAAIMDALNFYLDYKFKELKLIMPKQEQIATVCDDDCEELPFYDV